MRIFTFMNARMNSMRSSCPTIWIWTQTSKTQQTADPKRAKLNICVHRTRPKKGETLHTCFMFELMVLVRQQKQLHTCFMRELKDGRKLCIIYIHRNEIVAGCILLDGGGLFFVCTFQHMQQVATYLYRLFAPILSIRYAPILSKTHWNIVSFIGLLCKRDLSFEGALWLLYVYVYSFERFYHFLSLSCNPTHLESLDLFEEFNALVARCRSLAFEFLHLWKYIYTCEHVYICIYTCIYINKYKYA